MSIKILHGDCREVLRNLPSGSVQCCVTSPPYYGLRDYGVVGQIGLEVSPDAYVAELVMVFREVRRVLRDDGTLWLNLGDSYATQPGKGGNTPQTKHPSNSYPGAAPHRSKPKRLPVDHQHYGVHMSHCNQGEYEGVCCYGDDNECPACETIISGIKPKDLIGIPWMVAFALRADGWWLRRDIIWSKPNPMPESVTDRPTTAHEYVFLLTKSARYFWDAEAIAEPSEYPGDNRALRTDARKVHDLMCADNGSRARTGQPTGPTRNARSVWTIATSPTPEAHFATFPPELAERCILAGTSEKGCCSACGAPWARVTTKGEPDVIHRLASGADSSGGYNGQSIKNHGAHGIQNASDVKRRILEGMREKTYSWEPSCGCAAAVVPCVVLDPFSGAGTALMVADRLVLDAIGIELNPEYIDITKRRVVKDAGMFAEIT